MLVGDVRCATADTGCSCTLSGGSQWSSGPTKVSKKRPGLAGEPPEKDDLVGGQPRGAARQRPAEPPGDSRGGEPEAQEGRWRRPAPLAARVPDAALRPWQARPDPHRPQDRRQDPCGACGPRHPTDSTPEAACG